MAELDTRKTIILTGASRGIGHATVKRFSRESWRVIPAPATDRIVETIPLRRLGSTSEVADIIFSGAPVSPPM